MTRVLNKTILTGLADLIERDFITLTKKYGFDKAISFLREILPEETIKDLIKHKTEILKAIEA